MSNYVFPSALPGVAISFTRSAETDVKIQRAVSGKEYRSTWQASPLYRYTLNFEFVRSAAAYAELQSLASFWARHFGQLDSFLFTDPEDNAVTAMGFGVGDGATTAFQLQRTLGGNVYDTTGSPWPTQSTPRVNLVGYTDDFVAGAWFKGNCTTANNQTYDPLGGRTSGLLVEGAVNGQHFLTEAYTIQASQTYCASLFCKRGTGVRNVVLQLDTLSGTHPTIVVDLATGAVVSAVNGVIASGCVVLPNGWFRPWLTFSSNTGGAGTGFGILIANEAYATSYAGDGSSSIYLWGPQLEISAFPTQRIYAAGAAPTTVTPAYWPAVGDGFEPVTDTAAGGPIILKDGAFQSFTTWTQSATGLITFTAPPASGAVLTWSGSYYRRARFADNNLSAERIVSQIWSAKKIELVGVKP